MEKKSIPSAQSKIIQPGKSLAAAAARQNVNKPEASSINASQNANPSRVLHEITTPHASGKPIMNEIPLPTFTELPAMLANMNDVMALLVQGNKIFSAIKDMPVTLQRMNSTGDILQKLMKHSIQPEYVFGR
ncbi:hypothetical protein AVEN_7594-1 [Araneus ventricosus]|uniref:Uncharacterized protein n=1 Tax=Araneus ventricosus TaxID=182803 RepID=A0A4Y2QW03_ARAVE|nr:hypothetical protein AVEN_7594-1 [Araneus ventricosus]